MLRYVMFHNFRLPTVERSGSWGRASDSRLRGPGFESCAAVLKPWASFFTLVHSAV